MNRFNDNLKERRELVENQVADFLNKGGAPEVIEYGKSTSLEKFTKEFREKLRIEEEERQAKKQKKINKKLEKQKGA